MTKIWEEVWEDIATSELAWERELHESLRRDLTVVPPFKVWSNFEFIDLYGAAFDVDMMVLTRAGIFLVELFAGTGTVEVSDRHWRWTDSESRVQILDNPITLARDRAQRIREFVDEYIQEARCPTIHGVVLVVREDTTFTFSSPDLNRYITAVPEHPTLPSIIGALESGDAPGLEPHALTEDVLARFEHALEDVGLFPSKKYRVVGEWQCGKLLETSENHQDYIARHIRQDIRRRVRVFFSPRNVAKEQIERLNQAATREFEMVRQLEHPSILRVLKKIYDGRPALIFDHPETSVRLDHYLELRKEDRDGGQMTVRERLELLRQVAEAIQYAHRKKIIHRALTPQSVLVEPSSDPTTAPNIHVYNWQAALDRARQTGTRHIMGYMADASAVYTAPEVSTGQRIGEATDVWGLGTIAYLLFVGEPPAEDHGALISLLMKRQGLSLTARLDGIPEALEQLVFNATRPLVRDRTPSVEAFMEQLERVWNELKLGDATGSDERDPLEAQQGDLLDERWKVIGRLGSGASATALLVEDAEAAGKERVLKIAHTDKDAMRLEREARELATLADARLVVSCHGVVDVGTRRALILDNAGESLRERLGSKRQSLDDLRRFGQDLCEILCELESHHIWHRDIKPANLGIGAPDGSTKQLMLFDFSLAGTSPEHTEVGTSAYRDPMLARRKRWDEHADRWSAAITLYEMATGSLPRWSDDSSPLFDAETRMVLDADAFPSSVRMDLSAFFTQALHPDAGERFETALQMRRAWKKIFEDTTHTAHDDVAASIESATRASSVRELELSPAAREALDRLEVFTVGDLMDAHPQSIYFQRGTSATIRKELQKVREQLIARLPEQERPFQDDDEPKDKRDYSSISLDRCAEYAFSSGSDQLALAMGLEDVDVALPWPTRKEMAVASGEQERATFEAFFEEIAAGWKRALALRDLRDDLSVLIERNGGAMTDEELARALLAWRGSRSRGSRRMALAAVMARVALEAEAMMGEAARYRLHRAGRANVIVLSSSDLHEVLAPLGRRADALAGSHPLLGEHTAYVELARVCEEYNVTPPRSGRLLSLAAATSTGAALSSRRELYPIGMEARRAIRLASGVISSQQELSEDELVERVMMRYPDAEALPRGSRLEAMLEDLGLPLRWSQEALGGKGGYVSTSSRALHLTGSFTMATSVFSALDDREAYDLKMFEKNLQSSFDHGGFRAMMANPKHISTIEQRLRERFEDLERVSSDAIWISALEAAAAAMPRRKLRWEHLAGADAPDAPEKHRFLFGQVIKSACAIAEAQLESWTGKNILLVHPGLFGRYAEYGSMQVLERWRDKVNTSNGPRVLWLLLPADLSSDEPKIDQRAVPRMSPNEVLRIQKKWLAKVGA